MKEIIEKRQIGTFVIGKDALFKHPKAIQKFLSEMLIIRAEFFYETFGIKYTAYGKDFCSVPKHTQSKIYELEFVYLVVDDEGNEELANIQVKS